MKQDPRTAFAIRISELQQQHNYTNEYVLEHLKLDNDDLEYIRSKNRKKDENNDNDFFISDHQVLYSYKSGKRKPRDMDIALKTFSRFYDVTADYLLGLSDTPNPQIKSVQEATGLSEGAIRRLAQFRDKYPRLLDMLDVLIAGTSEEDMDSWFSLYRQIYDDYKESKADNAYTEVHEEMMKMQKRVFFMQAVYDRWKKSVIAKLSEQFDKEILEEQFQYEYDHSQESLNEIYDDESSERPPVMIRIICENPIVTPVNRDNNE